MKQRGGRGDGDRRAGVAQLQAASPACDGHWMAVPFSNKLKGRNQRMRAGDALKMKTETVHSHVFKKKMPS